LKIIDDEVAEMECSGIIEPSRNPWSSPIVIAKKKDGRPRFCIDFRKVNEALEKDAYPLPQVKATLDKLRGARYLSTIDLKKWLLAGTACAREPPDYRLHRPGARVDAIPCRSDSIPHQLSTSVRYRKLGPELEPNVFVYLDDIIIVSPNLKSHLQHLREVFNRLHRANLRINPEKCKFGTDQLRYLGHLITRNGISTVPEKTEVITRIPPPRNVREIRQFLGLLSWYRRFVENFSDRARPLTRLTSKKVKWQ